MGEVHDLLKLHGAETTRRLNIDRRVVDAAAGYLSSEDGEISFIYSGWAQAALPHRRLADDAHWQIQSDRVSLIVQPGLKAIQGGPLKSIGVPYGSRARLILLFLQFSCLAKTPGNPSWRQVNEGRQRSSRANKPVPNEF